MSSELKFFAASIDLVDELKTFMHQMAIKTKGIELKSGEDLLKRAISLNVKIPNILSNAKVTYTPHPKRIVPTFNPQARLRTASFCIRVIASAGDDRFSITGCIDCVEVERDDWTCFFSLY